jgi:hypothetical protein
VKKSKMTKEQKINNQRMLLHKVIVVAEEWLLDVLVIDDDIDDEEDDNNIGLPVTGHIEEDILLTSSIVRSHLHDADSRTTSKMRFV